MNGFSTVEKLKELEQPGMELQRLAALQSAAPLLLDIAGEIRPGDSDRFKLLIINNEQRWTDEQWQKSMDMLRRYQRMAERMHD